jgi:hypothetical protein
MEFMSVLINNIKFNPSELREQIKDSKLPQVAGRYYLIKGHTLVYTDLHKVTQAARNAFNKFQTKELRNLLEFLEKIHRVELSETSSSKLTSDSDLHMGIMTSQEAEDLLKYQPEGTWILRYSPERKQNILSFKDPSWKKSHLVLDAAVQGRSLAEILAHYHLKKENNLLFQPLIHSPLLLGKSIGMFESEMILKNRPPGAWLLRSTADEPHGVVLSWKKADGTIRHGITSKIEPAFESVYEHLKFQGLNAQNNVMRFFKPLAVSEFTLGHERITPSRMTQDVAIHTLADKPTGSWLLRQNSRGEYIVSIKVNSRQVIHRAVLQENIARGQLDLGKLFGVDRRFRIELKPLPRDFDLPEPILDQEQARIEAAMVREQKDVSKYDRQLVLNLGSGNSARGIQAKEEKKHRLTTDIIDLRKVGLEKDLDLSDLKNVTYSSRIYIIGHCAPGSPFISSDEGIVLDVNYYVDLLKKQATQLQKKDPNKKLTISCVACFAGVGISDMRLSFAEELSKALDKAGIPAVVLAPTASIKRWRGVPEDYKKIIGGKHHAPGSKVRVVTKKGATKVSQVYDRYGKRASSAPPKKNLS